MRILSWTRARKVLALALLTGERAVTTDGVAAHEDVSREPPAAVLVVDVKGR